MNIETCSAEELISILKSKNIFFEFDGEKLRCKAKKGELSDDILLKIKEKKENIKEILLAEKEAQEFFQSIPQSENSSRYAVSPAQKNMFVMNKMNPESTAYNLTQVLKIEGNFNSDKFLNAFKKIAERHETLRTSFEMQNGEAFAVVHDKIEINVETEEVSGDEEQINSIVYEFIRPYNLSEYPLFRLKTVKRTTEQGTTVNYIIIDMHHIISDGISISLLINELNSFYKNEELPLPSRKYSDYASWSNKLMQSAVIKREKQYWKNSFNEEVPLLNLPTDFKRPNNFTFNGESVKKLIDVKTAKELNALARKNKVTLFSVLAACYYILLYKYTGQEDIVIGTSMAGRRNADLNDIIGVFVNTCALRNKVESNKSFEKFLNETGKLALQAMDNEDYPFENLVDDLKIKRDPSHNPLFDAMFVMLNMELNDLTIDGAKVSYFDYKKKMAQFDLEMNAVENENGIEIELCYCTDLFKRETVELMLSHYENILRAVLENPSVLISKIDMLTTADKELILNKFNDKDSDFSKNKLVNELIQTRVKMSSDSIAVVFKDKTLTYSALNEKANELAVFLVKNGVKKDDIVGLMVKRSEKLLIGQLAILKSGGAYLPIDPDYPKERIDYMLENSNAKIIVSETDLIEKIFADENNGKLFIDIESKESYIKDQSFKPATGDSNRLAYVIYTSGSTGKPKGVMLEHRSVVNFIESAIRILGLKEKETIACLTTVSFDIFVLETLLALTKGLKIVVADENSQRDSKKLNDLLFKNKVDLLQATPTRLMLILHGASSLSCFKTLKKIMVGGEAFPPALFSEIRQYSNAVIFNLYGPTETTVYSLIKKIESADDVTIGRPIANTKVYILDKDGNNVPKNAQGELYIGGVGLARGYFGREDLTAQKFVPDKFQNSGRMYATGDLAKWCENGEVLCLGRIDQQVKIRGFRVELGEIEKKLQKYTGIENCAVIALNDGTGEKFLAAYYTSKEEIPVSSMRKFLSQSLPDYMIPETFMLLKEMPKTPNGKIDRKALPEPERNRPILSNVFKKANSECEKKLASIWQTVLKRDIVGVDDNFFDLGGNSLLLITMQSEVEKLYPDKISVTDIFANPTISKMAEIITGVSTKKETVSINKKSEKVQDIAIIGISGRFGSANNPEEYFKKLCQGKDFVRKLPENRLHDCEVYENIMEKSGFRTEKTEYINAAFLDRIDGFDAEFFGISPKEADLMDPNQRFFLERACEAIEDAGYGGKLLRGTRTGVFVGQSNDLGVDYRHYGSTVSTVSDQVGVSGNINSVIGARISYLLDLKGPSVMIDTACSSTLAALHTAVRSLQNGDCDAAIVGGCKITIVPEKNAQNASKLGIQSTSERSNAFDAKADGMGCGEGGGAIFIKPLDKAEADNDNIYAIIKGSAMNQDGSSIGLTAPNMTAQTDVIINAWQNADINPETVSYIETHGTGTKLGDPIEIAGITKAFEKFTDKKQFCAVTSVKSNIGHLDSAAGIASVIKAVMCLKYKTLPPTLHFDTPNPKIDFSSSPVYVNTHLKKWESNSSKRRCGISSFGLSGTNVHVVIEEYDKKRKNDIPIIKCDIFTLSAKNENSFNKLIKNYLSFLETAENCNLSDICFTQNTGRSHMNYRLAVVAENVDDFKNKLKLILKNGCAPDTFIGNFKIVSPKKTILNKNEFTPQNIETFSQEANKVVEEFANASENDKKLTLLTLAELYIKGAEIDFNSFYDNKFNRLSLPAYPFNETRHWVEADRVIEKAANVAMNAENKRNVKLLGRENGKYSETEKKIAEIFAESLGLKELNVYDDFFELGGNSLVAIKAETQAEKEGIIFESTDLYNYRTVETLAAFADKKPLLTKAVKKECRVSEDLASKDVTEIKNIEPFNDVFYRSCFFNSFFPILKCFKKLISPFIANDIAAFGEDVGALTMQYLSEKPLENLLTENGIETENFDYSEDLVSKIKEAIKAQKPVIVYVDCFYESIRPDMFNKTHWQHTILIYGFDNVKQNFLVIEHKIKDNLSYEKRLLPFADLNAMCRGYKENFGNHDNLPTFCAFNSVKDAPEIDSQKAYIQNFFSKKSLLIEKTELVREFSKEVEEVFDEETLFFKEGESLVNSISSVVNAKEAEKYKLQTLFNEQDNLLLTELETLLELWKSLRRTAAKCLYAKSYSKEKMALAAQKFKAAYSMEIAYINEKSDYFSAK